MLISIGILVYNSLESFERALKSALSQTYKEIEILISKDNSPNIEIDLIAKEYAKNDSRIRYYLLKSSLKTVNNFQFLSGKANGRYFSVAN